MSHSITSDLLSPSLDTILLTDTFNEWVTRTNTIVDYLNPLNVYDVIPVTGSGITESRVSNYALSNGVVELSLFHKAGEQGISADSGNILGLNFLNMTDIGSGVANEDLYAVFDTDAGVAKKVLAENSLPPGISGDHRFGGDITIAGNLVVEGTDTALNVQNLRTEDEQIELAFNHQFTISITGSKSNLDGSPKPADTDEDFAAKGFVVGATAYYSDDGGASGFTQAEAALYIKSINFSSTANAEITLISPFLKGGPDSFANTGFIAPDGGTGRGFTFGIIEDITGASGFPTDSGYQRAPGIVVKGADGDKEILWHQSAVPGVTNGTFFTNKSFGVSGSNAIRSAYFDSTDDRFGDLKHNFVFAAASGNESTLHIAENPVTGGNIFSFTTATGGASGLVNDLRISFGLSGATGTKDAAVIHIFGGTGVSGSQFPNTPIASFAENLNVDQLDGAHATTDSAAYHIPIAGADGKIDGWISGQDDVTRTITTINHGLVVGEAVRIRSATGGVTSAIGNSPENAEAIGIVSTVVDANNVKVTQSGFVSGLGSSTKIESITGGEVFFLSRTVSGGLTTTAPSYNEGDTLVQKAMFIGVDDDSGFVLPYIGSVVQDATDELYLQGIIPVGTIYPYTGSIIPNDDFLFCDGKLKSATDFPDLFDIVGHTYGVSDIHFDGTDTLTLTGGASTRDIAVNDKLVIKKSDNTTVLVNVDTVTTTTIEVSDAGAGDLPTSAGSVTLQSDSDTNTNFFLPDLRNRSAIGVGKSDIHKSTRTLGQQGGFEELSRGGDEIGDDSQAAFQSTGSGIDSIQDPFLATNFIIRAKPGVKALVFTGHNHDDIYPRIQGGSTMLTPSVAGPTAFGLGFSRSSGVTFPCVQIAGNVENGPHVYHTTSGVVAAADDYLIGVGINDSAETVTDSFIVYTDKDDNNVDPTTSGRELLHVGTDGKHYFRSDGDESGIEQYTPTEVGLEILGNLRTVTGQSYSTLQSQSSSGSITLDFDDGNVHEITLGGSISLANPSNVKSGAAYTIILKQDGTGGRALSSIGSVFKFPNGIDPVLSQAANDIDVISAIADSSGNLLCNFNPNFS